MYVTVKAICDVYTIIRSGHEHEMSQKFPEWVCRTRNFNNKVTLKR